MGGLSMTYSLYSVLAIQLQESIGIGFSKGADKLYSKEPFKKYTNASIEQFSSNHWGKF